MNKNNIILISISALALSGCGGGGSQIGGNASSTGTLSAAGPAAIGTIGDVTLASSSAGVTPFISIATFTGQSLAALQSVSYSIQPKPTASSGAVNVSYTEAALLRRGYLSAAGNALNLPVFGLYAGYSNNVTVTIAYRDGSTQVIPVILTTSQYVDPKGVYDKPVIVKQRQMGSTLGFDFFALKSVYGSPVIVDTDAEVRWIGPSVASGVTSIFVDNGFEVADPGDAMVSRLELDGSKFTWQPGPSDILGFNHNIDLGRNGLLAETTTAFNPGSSVAEIVGPSIYTNGRGELLREWDFAKILTDYMVSQGDDASAFVRPAVDWFHANASTYDPSDNTLIVSSRENFLMKVDYDTGNILWIFGDPTKYWYTFPSLRAKALSLAPGGLYPIGQHATSITSDGLLMIMNDGEASVNQPKGTSAGASRTYSAVSAYAIDAATMTATEVWHFDYGQSIFGAFCGSSYETPGNSLLIDYASASGFTAARLVGLDANHDVVFDFQYANAACNTAWNAVPVNLGNIQFQ